MIIAGYVLLGLFATFMAVKFLKKIFRYAVLLAVLALVIFIVYKFLTRKKSKAKDCVQSSQPIIINNTMTPKDTFKDEHTSHRFNK